VIVLANGIEIGLNCSGFSPYIAQGPSGSIWFCEGVFLGAQKRRAELCTSDSLVMRRSGVRISEADPRFWLVFSRYAPRARTFVRGILFGA